MFDLLNITHPDGALLLDKYRLEKVIGRGGMGVVFAATHVQLQEKVAVKVLLPEARQNSEVVERFIREGQAAARLRGEHAVRILDIGTLSDDSPYLVMEFLAGEDLSSLVARRQLPHAASVDLILQACVGLAEAHRKGLIHRDIKPSNLFVTSGPDGSPLVKLLDFGISKLPVGSVSSLTRTQVAMGTPAYMSPEQMRCARDVDARADIWALGVTLYECLAGSTPFAAEAFSALCFQVATEAPPPLPDYVPTGLARIVFRCLEKEPAHRFASVGELAVALEPFASNYAVAAVLVERARATCAPTPLPSSPPAAVAQRHPTTLGSSLGQITGAPRRRSRWPVGVMGSVAIGAIVSAALLSGRGHSVDSAPRHAAHPAADSTARGGSTRVPAPVPTTPAPVEVTIPPRATRSPPAPIVAAPAVTREVPPRGARPIATKEHRPKPQTGATNSAPATVPPAPPAAPSPHAPAPTGNEALFPERWPSQPTTKVTP